MMKKVSKIILVFIMILTLTFVNVPLVDAKTLRELKNELQAYKDKLAEAEAGKQRTQSEINTSRSTIASSQAEIEANQQRVIEITNESAALEIEIAEGKEKLSKLLETYQVAKGDNIYLEYVFDATSYEDLVYRYAVIEQIMSYIDGEIDSWNAKIEKNNALKQELAEREIELNKQIASLSARIEELGPVLSSYEDVTIDAKAEVSSTQALVDWYTEIGCKLDDDLDVCAGAIGDTRFIKPLPYGTITSYFGYRIDPITGRSGAFHSGTDIGGNSEGTSVYSIANGKVGKIIWRSSCGGNQVYVYHMINGKKYTSAYLHLLTINVSVGQTVSNQTVVGTVGGGAGTRSYDSCSTGAHLHLGLGTGWYGSDYVTYATWRANLISAADALNLPPRGTYWRSRY